MELDFQLSVQLKHTDEILYVVYSEQMFLNLSL